MGGEERIALFMTCFRLRGDMTLTTIAITLGPKAKAGSLL